MIKYKKAKILIDQVAEDLDSYADNGLIDYSKLYKVLRRCNGDLGQRINPEKQAVIHIVNYRGMLPEDFVALNYALVCSTKRVNSTPPKGFQIEYETLCKNGSTCGLHDCDPDYAVYQLLDDEWTQYIDLEAVRLSPKSYSRCTETCMNTKVHSPKILEINPDGSVTTTFKGDVYINYVGSMEDDDNDLLVIDHEQVEGFYEAALIRAILKSAHYNKYDDVQHLYQDAKREYDIAKSLAVRFVNTPGYRELVDTVQAERTKVYNKYFKTILGN